MDVFADLEAKYHEWLDGEERTAPPFALVLAIIAIVVIALLGWFVVLPLFEGGVQVTLQVENALDNAPLSGASLQVSFDGHARLLFSDSDGKAVVKVSPGATLSVYASLQGFQDADESFSVESGGETFTVFLTPTGQTIASKYVSVKDSSCQHDVLDLAGPNKKVTFKFSCAGSATLNDIVSSSSELEFSAQKQQQCPSPTVTVVVPGFEQGSQSLDTSRTVFCLSQEETKATIIASVKDKDSSKALEGVKVNLYKSSGSSLVFQDAAYSDVSGTASFSVDAGSYKLTAISEDNNYETTNSSPFSVEVGDRKDVELKMQYIPPSDRVKVKIFIVNS
ncbi:MAG: hypothetical protein V1847_01475, partial [Candidatus Diapherotrites archaeon]